MSSRVIVKEHPIMRVSNAKGELKELFDAVIVFKDPIDSKSPQTKIIIKFFEFAASQIPEIRNTSTGREYELHSREAIEIFGVALADSMYKAMNKVTYLMTCKSVT